jgi:uncharacterized protein (TIGR03790 family)
LIRTIQRLGILLWLLPLLSSAQTPRLSLGKTGLNPDELAIIVNGEDPDSEAIAVYYQQHRAVPDRNIIRVRFPAKSSNLGKNEFLRIKAEVDRQTPENVQAYALAWTRPYRVDCMSITAAFTFGFDLAYCSKTLCGTTRESPYFQSASRLPQTDFRIRPSMMLAGSTIQEVKLLILRGVAADSSFPKGTAYLVKTDDTSRSVRSIFFDSIQKLLGDALAIQRVEGNSVRNARDVLFYFTGLPVVPHLQTLKFRPGAIADHLTSTGGMLTDSKQMSILRWLEAGASGSYGTVVEPCNHLSKFPQPAVVMSNYLNGATLLEAYWKSLAWPGEGVFIGEPLARPYGPLLESKEPGKWTLKLYSPVWKNLRLERASTPAGPYESFRLVPVHPGLNLLNLQLPEEAEFFYHLQL